MCNKGSSVLFERYQRNGRQLFFQITQCIICFKLYNKLYFFSFLRLQISLRSIFKENNLLKFFNFIQLLGAQYYRNRPVRRACYIPKSSRIVCCARISRLAKGSSINRILGFLNNILASSNLIL